MRDKHLKLNPSLLAKLFHGLLYAAVVAYILFEPFYFTYKLVLIVLFVLIICVSTLFNWIAKGNIRALSLKGDQWFTCDENNDEQAVILTGKSRVLGVWVILHFYFQAKGKLPQCLVVWPDAMSEEDFAFLRRYLLLAHKPHR